MSIVLCQFVTETRHLMVGWDSTTAELKGTWFRRVVDHAAMCLTS